VRSRGEREDDGKDERREDEKAEGVDAHLGQPPGALTIGM
jgi:hypothetical protein